MSDYFERSKEAWVRASKFPSDKEAVYPDHKLVQEFDLIHNKSVYEYGCGGGSDVMSYLRRGNKVTATDIVQENLDVTRERVKDAGLPQPTLVLLGNSYPLPFSDESFDIISSHGVLHHIVEPSPVLEEFHRILKKDGMCYIMLYTDVMEDYFNEMGLIDRFMKQYNVSYNEAFGYCTDDVGTPYSRSYSVEQAMDLFDEAKFTVIDYNYWLNDHFCTYKLVKDKICHYAA